MCVQISSAMFENAHLALFRSYLPAFIGVEHKKTGVCQPVTLTPTNVLSGQRPLTSLTWFGTLHHTSGRPEVGVRGQKPQELSSPQPTTASSTRYLDPLVCRSHFEGRWSHAWHSATHEKLCEAFHALWSNTRKLEVLFKTVWETPEDFLYSAKHCIRSSPSIGVWASVLWPHRVGSWHCLNINIFANSESTYFHVP